MLVTSPQTQRPSGARFFDEHRCAGRACSGSTDMPKVCNVEDCNAKHYCKGLCSKHYYRLRIHGTIDGSGLTGKGAARSFIIEASKFQGDDCLVWPFSKDENGYGNIGWCGRHTRANRVSLSLATGTPMSTPLDAAHTCHNPSCVNPKHLYWATRKKNIHDRIADGTYHCGEDISSAVLTSSDVVAIRKDGRPHAVVASEYGVTAWSIYAVKSRRTWSHIK